MLQRIYSFLILLAILQLINSRIISTNDLKEALPQAQPGDIIELKSGIYKDVPYTLKKWYMYKGISNKNKVSPQCRSRIRR